MLKGKKILIVEDSRTMRLQLKMMLKQEGAIIEDVGSEWGMLNKINEYGVIVDLIIMDLVLNNEDGLDIITRLKENSQYKDVPILILTEKADIDTIKVAIDLGIKCYLKKPIKRIELINRINTLLNIM